MSSNFLVPWGKGTLGQKSTLFISGTMVSGLRLCYIPGNSLSLPSWTILANWSLLHEEDKQMNSSDDDDSQWSLSMQTYPGTAYKVNEGQTTATEGGGIYLPVEMRRQKPEFQSRAQGHVGSQSKSGPENGGRTEPPNSQSCVSGDPFACAHTPSVQEGGKALPSLKPWLNFYRGVWLGGQASISGGPPPTPGMLVWNARYDAYSQTHP